MLPSNDDIVETIKARKVCLGLTNQQLSDATGIPLSNVKKYLAGDIKNPGLFYMAAACKYLGISLDEMFDIQVKRNVEKSEIDDIRAELAKERKSRIITTIVISLIIVTAFLLQI